MTKIPEDYRWPGGDAVAEADHAYWIHEDDDDSYSLAITRYVVIAAVPGEQHIVGERFYLHWAMRVVDALRASHEEVT